MSGNYSIMVGTTGAGLFQSADSGESWRRIGSPFSGESQVRALAVDPQSPNVVYAGSNDGIYRSEDSGQNWAKLDSPMDGLKIWSIAINPSDSATVFAGTSPPFLFRSKNGGQTWEKLTAEIAQECAIGLPRVTAMVVDPVDEDTVYAGVEIDGVYRSRDGGDTWAHVDKGITNPDIHGMAVSLGKHKTLLVSTPNEIFASQDEGETFQSLAVTKSFAMPYCRWVAVKTDDSQVLFAANGDAAIGNTGTIQRSTDGGRSWETQQLPVEPNSPIWNFATHPADPELIFANSIYGELYRSADGGDSWEKLKKEFTEVRALAWTPN
ncbi:MAG: hypothetical protein FI723_07230 [SAR202 cluster bacterium]|nr:hypothetical protein [SAR202 cluster bacterium]